MNEYIFYTIEGYTYPPKEDKEVEKREEGLAH